MQRYDGRPVDWGGHLVLVHDTERQRRIGIAAWARRSLDLGAKVLYIEPADEPSESSLLHLLREHAVPVDDAVDSGQLEVFAASEEAYRSDWQSEVVDKALAAGYPTVAWSGASTTAWSVMSPTTHAEIEWATDELCRTRPVSVLCQYAATLPQTTLETVCAMHGAGVRESQLRTRPVPGGLALAGSVDASNERILRSALVAAAATAPSDDGVFTIGLSQLEFLDVAGARAFVTGTTAHRIKGGRVRLQGARRPVDSLLHLLQVEWADGFEVEETS